MMKLLFYSTLFIAFGYIKDAVFIFSEWKYSMLLNDVVRSIDLFFIPLICSFFLEASRPGLVTRGKLLLALGVQAVFSAIFAFYPDKIVIFATIAYDFIISIITIFDSSYRVTDIAFRIPHQKIQNRGERLIFTHIAGGAR